MTRNPFLTTCRNVRRTSRRESQRRRRFAFFEALERRELLASDFTNPFLPLDVSNDTVITPLDVLQVINDLNEHGPRELPTPDSPVEFFVDSNGDGSVSPIDALVIINTLNDDVEGPSLTVSLSNDTAPDGETNDDRITSDARLSGTVTDPAGVRLLTVKINDLEPIDLQVASDGSFEVVPDFLINDFEDGSHTFEFIAEDGKQTKAISPITITFDTTPPEPLAGFGLTPETDTGLFNDDGVTRLTDVTLTGDAESGAIVTLSNADGEIGSQIANSPVSFSLSGLTEGTATYTATVVDAAGNVSETAEFSATIDTTAPELTLDAPNVDGMVSPGARLLGQLDDTSDQRLVTYRLGDGAEVPVAVTNSGIIDRKIDFADVVSGQQQLHLTASDLAGNTITSTLDVAVDLDQGPLSIIEMEPLPNENEVGVTFRPRITFNKPVDPGTVTAESFNATFAGNELPTSIVVSNNNDFAWLFHETAFPGSSLITVTVDGDLIQTADGELLDADGDGTPGGKFTFDFMTGSTTPVLGTSLTGIVLDPGPDRQPHTSDDSPLPGVEVFFLGMEDDIRTTDSDGRFTFDAVPVGNVKVAVNGLTVTPFDGVFFPEMVMDANMLPAQTNFVMPGMEAMYLPRIDEAVLNQVDASAGITIVANDEAARELPAEQRELLGLEVPADSLVAPDGTMMESANIGISTVPPELVVDMLPPGVLQHTFDITIQARGVANFSTPAPLTFPNVFDAAPGTQLNFLSFDHTSGRLVIEGNATVSADGLSVRTDPGVGVTRPGWHGMTPSGSEVEGTTKPTHQCPTRNSGGAEGEGPSTQECPPEPGDFPVSGSVTLDTDFDNKFVTGSPRDLFLRSDQVPEEFSPIQLSIKAFIDQAKIPNDPDGFGLSGTLDVAVTVDDTASEFLDGFKSQQFQFHLLDTDDDDSAVKFISAEPKPISDAQLREFDEQGVEAVLWGTRVQVKGTTTYQTSKTDPARTDTVFDHEFYIYRYISVAREDIERRGVMSLLTSPIAANALPFEKTVEGGSRYKTLLQILPAHAAPTFDLAAGQNSAFSTNTLVSTSGDRRGTTIEFKPKSPGEQSSSATVNETLSIRSPGQSSAVGDITLSGVAQRKQKVFLNGDGLSNLIAAHQAEFELQPPAERDTIHIPGNPAEVSAVVTNHVKSVFGPFAEGIEFVNAPGPSTISVNWFRLGNGIVVNDSRDLPDADPSDGVPDVDLTVEGLQTTLRSAIQHANATPLRSHTSHVIRNAHDGRTRVVRITSPLPELRQRTNIYGGPNGLTIQPDSQANASVFDGLVLPPGSLARNINVSGFSGDGIRGTGEISVIHATVTGNGKNGVSHEGPGRLLIGNSNISNNGGRGIDSTGTLYIESRDERVVIANNELGGVRAAGPLLTAVRREIEGATTINNNGGHGIEVTAEGSQNAAVHLILVTLENNKGYGLVAADAELAMSKVTGNDMGGIKGKPNGHVNLIASEVSRNGGVGVELPTPLASRASVSLDGAKVNGNHSHGITAGRIRVYSDTNQISEVNRNGGDGIRVREGRISRPLVVRENKVGINGNGVELWTNDVTITGNQTGLIWRNGFVEMAGGKLCGNTKRNLVLLDANIAYNSAVPTDTSCTPPSSENEGREGEASTRSVVLAEGEFPNVERTAELDIQHGTSFFADATVDALVDAEFPGKGINNGGRIRQVVQSQSLPSLVTQEAKNTLLNAAIADPTTTVKAGSTDHQRANVMVVIDSLAPYLTYPVSEVSWPFRAEALAQIAAHEIAHILGAVNTAIVQPVVDFPANRPPFLGMNVEEEITVSIDGLTVFGREDVMAAGRYLRQPQEFVEVDSLGNVVLRDGQFVPTTLTDEPGTFQAGLSRDIIQMSLGLDWTDHHASNALFAYRQAFRELSDPLNPDSSSIPSFDVDPGAPAISLAVTATDLTVGNQVTLPVVRADGLGGAAHRTMVTLSNVGFENVNVREVTLESENEGFVLDGVTDFPIIGSANSVAFGDLAFDVVFDPTESGPQSAVVTVSFDGDVDPIDIKINAIGQSPAADIHLDVANRNVGGSLIGNAETSPQFARIENKGLETLSVTSIVATDDAGAGQFELSGLEALPSQASPLVLQPGEGIFIDLGFVPATVGLQRGILEIHSNDPDTPIITQTVVGTGVPADGSGGHYGEDFVVVTTPNVEGSTVLRTESDATGSWTFFMPPETRIDYSVYDPLTGLIASGTQVTNIAGQPTTLPAQIYLASTAPDRDGDGVPADVEFAIGSSDENPDSNGDGIDDFEALAAGMNPLGDAIASTGVLGATRLGGEAIEVDVTVFTADSTRPLALVATGSFGASVVDVSDPTVPISLGSIDLDGSNTDVAAIAGQQQFFVAGGEAGLHLVDASDPSNLQLLRSIDADGAVSRIDVFANSILATRGTDLVRIDVSSGSIVDFVTVGASQLTDVLVHGNTAFVSQQAASGNGGVVAVDLTGETMQLRGAATITRGAHRLAFDTETDVLFVSSRSLGGFSAVDASDLDNMVLLSGTEDDLRLEGRAITIANSGRAVLGADLARNLSPVPVTRLYDVSDPSDTQSFSVEFPLPAVPNGVLQAGGQTLIADGIAGLQIVNFLAPDLAGIAPTISIEPLTDVDNETPGSQGFGGFPFIVNAEAFDDVQLARVDLLVDGVTAGMDLTAPFNLRALLPASAVGSTVSITALATDTGGNQTLSNEIVVLVEEFVDNSAPVIVETSIHDNDLVLANEAKTVEIRFDEALQPASFDASNYSIRNAGGAIINPLNAATDGDDRGISLDFPALAPGDYTFVIDAPNVVDLAGNPIGDDLAEFRFEAIAADVVWINQDGGSIADPANWSTGTEPTDDDVVFLPFEGLELQTPRFFGTLINRSHLTRGASGLDLVNGATGLIEDFGDFANVTNYGTLEFLRTSGTFGPDISGTFVNENTGTIRTLNAHTSGLGTLQFRVDNFVNRGLLQLESPLLFNRPGSTITNEGRIRFVSGELDMVNSTLVSDPANLEFFAAAIDPIGVDLASNADWTTTETITISAPGRLRVRGGSTVTAPTIVVGSGGTFDRLADALLDVRDGTVNANVSNEGWVLGRTSTATINGSVTNGVTGVVEVRGQRQSFRAGQLTIENGLTNRGLVELTAEPDSNGSGFGDDSTLVVNGAPLVNEGVGTVMSSPSSPNGSGNTRRIQVDEFRNAGTIQLDQNLNASVETFTFDGGSLAGTERIELSDTSIVLNEDLTIAGADVLVRQGSSVTGTGIISVGDTSFFDLRDAVIDVDVEISSGGTLRASTPNAVVNGLFTNQHGGKIEIVADNGSVNQHALLTANIGLTNHGVIELTGTSNHSSLDDAALAMPNQPLVNEAAGIVNLLRGAGSDSGDERRLDGNVINRGRIVVEHDAQFEVAGTTLTNEGILEVNVDALVFTDTQLVQDGGTIIGPGRINFDTSTLRLDSDLMLDDTTVLDVLTTSQVTGIGPMTIGGSASVVLRGMADVPIDVSGTLFIRQNQSTANQSLVINEAGTLDIKSFISLGSAVLTANAGITNHGRIAMDGSNTSNDTVLILNNEPLTNTSTGRLELLPGENAFNTKRIRGSILNGGTIFVQRETFFETDGTTLTNAGTLEVLDGPLRLTSGTAFVNTGSVTVAQNEFIITPSFAQTAGATTVNGTLRSTVAVDLQGGDLNGDGTIDADVINRGGIVGPGSSPGTLNISGDYTQEAGGSLAIEIGGTIPGDGFDVLSVSGSVTLAGTLALSLVNNFEPTTEHSFQALTADSLSGQFASATGTSAPNNLELIPEYNVTDVTIQIAEPLRLAGAISSGGTRITSTDVDLVRSAAIALWGDHFGTNEVGQKLANVEIRVVDLNDNLLGLTYDNTILLDHDAAGRGWFVDRTPNSDNDLPADQVDLLTTLAHELGHILDLPDVFDLLDDNLMSDSLAVGERRLPEPEDIDAILANWID